MSAAERIANELKNLPEGAAVSILEAAIKEHTKAKAPVESLRFYRMMNSAMDRENKNVSSAIIASVGMVAGAYNGFTVVDCSGRASIDTEILHKQFQQAYDACVKWGKPYQTVRIHNN